MRIPSRSLGVTCSSMAVTRVWQIGPCRPTPKGLRPKAQGCCTQLPWEPNRAEAALIQPTPKGLRPCHINSAAAFVVHRPRTQPLRGWGQRVDGGLFSRSPRVAAYSNPGLWDATPSGLRPVINTLPRHILDLLRHQDATPSGLLRL